jgi:hypothetical protein
MGCHLSIFILTVLPLKGKQDFGEIFPCKGKEESERRWQYQLQMNSILQRDNGISPV